MTTRIQNAEVPKKESVMTARKFRCLMASTATALAILVSPAIAERLIEPPAKPIVYAKVGSWKITHHPENKSCNAADVNLGSTTVLIEAGQKTTGAWWMILMINPKWNWTWGQDMELFLDTHLGNHGASSFRHGIRLRSYQRKYPKV
jgi:hypothetical protein